MSLKAQRPGGGAEQNTHQTNYTNTSTPSPGNEHDMHLFCRLCQFSPNAKTKLEQQQQMAEHVAGKRHQKAVARESGGSKENRAPAADGLACTHCKFTPNAKTREGRQKQLQEHVAGWRHRQAVTRYETAKLRLEQLKRKFASFQQSQHQSPFGAYVKRRGTRRPQHQSHAHESHGFAHGDQGRHDRYGSRPDEETEEEMARARAAERRREKERRREAHEDARFWQQQEQYERRRRAAQARDAAEARAREAREKEKQRARKQSSKSNNHRKQQKVPPSGHGTGTSTAKERAARLVATAADTLGVMPWASASEIRKAYKRQALKWHPDKNRGRESECAEVMKKINNAKAVLETHVATPSISADHKRWF